MPLSSGRRQAAVMFIFVTVVIDVLSLGIVIPVLPRLVEQFMGGNTALAAKMLGVFGTAWALMQFIFSPLLGVLSDRYGRRAVILISCSGLALDYFLMAMAPSIAWLFVGRVLSGICAASFSTGFAYVADVTPPEQRAAKMGLIGAAFGLGFVVGPAFGGILGHSNPRLPFWVAGALALVNAGYGFFVLPESLPLDKRAPFSWRRANPLGSLKLLRSHPELLGLASVTLLINLAHVVLPAITVLYMSYRYHFSTDVVGYTLAGVGVCSLIVQGGLVRPVVARLGERKAMAIGLFFGAVGFAIYCFATTAWLFWIAVPVMSIWGLAGPSIQGLMTRRVSASEQGQLQGANASITGIAGMIGPGLFTGIFAACIAHPQWQAPGAAYLVAAGLLLAAMMLGWRVTRSAPKRDAPAPEVVSEPLTHPR